MTRVPRGLAIAVCLALVGCSPAVLHPPSSPPSDARTTWWPGEFPTRESVGLPEGWEPKLVVSGDLRLETDGEVVEDLRITDGLIIVSARDVTLRRIQAIGSRVVNDYTGSCHNGLLIENAEFTPHGATSDRQPEVVGAGGYTLRESVVDGAAEGVRAGGRTSGCGPVRIEATFIRISAPDSCDDWHGDGVQGFDGPPVTVRRSTILLEEREDCRGTAPFFYPRDQGNTSVDIDGLLVSGGGYPFRTGMPGTVRNLNVVDGSWGYAPVDVNCSVVDVWEAQSVTLDERQQPTPLGSIECAGDGV